MSLRGPDRDQIHSMFSKVAKSYDRANTVLSLGVHHLWRKQLVKSCQLQGSEAVLDCATGTGDLAIEFKKNLAPNSRVVGTDFNANMLQSAPEKARRLNLDIEFSVADAMELPFSDGEFDIVSMAFGIRNVADPSRALDEMYRVLKPGGQLVILEFGQVEWPLVGPAYRFYSSVVLPRIGGWISSEPSAYRYLQRSSAAFPCRKEFLQLMKQGRSFRTAEFQSLSAGIAYIYRGIK